MEKIVKQIATDFSIVFRNEKLLHEAFTHSSYVNEHRHLALQDNERLEFLGDAVRKSSSPIICFILMTRGMKAK